MVKTKTKVITKTMIIIATIIMFLLGVNRVFAVEDTTNFEVNVRESLTVSISSPTTWASGDIDTFLRNKFSLYVSTNNAAGFTASMTTKTADTFLTNTSKNSAIIPTLAAGSTRGSFPANYWGYSLGTTATLNNQTYNETDVGNLSSNYYPLVNNVSTPITVLSSSSASSGSQDIYFGAKANASLPSGTYVGTVVINVVTGVIDNTNPITPVNPATPTEDEVATYRPAPTGSSSGSTTYTHRSSSSGTSTVTTEISAADNTDAYTGYTPPQGVFSDTTLNIAKESMLITGFATAASVATTSGLFFFIAAKRREIDEDDIEE